MSNTEPPADWATIKAQQLVARWEHGDAAHRQWLRDVAIPDLIIALRAAANKSAAINWLGWAVDQPGLPLYVQYGENEARAWQMALGWPSAEEINHAKNNGARAFAVTITPSDQAELPITPPLITSWFIAYAKWLPEATAKQQDTINDAFRAGYLAALDAAADAKLLTVK